MEHQLLKSLPNEIWMTMLNEWFGQAITLCAFDIALCNRLLREKYYVWLRSTSIMFAKLYFKIKTEGERGLFLNWCLKRKIHPKAISMHMCAASNGAKGQQQKFQMLLGDLNDLELEALREIEVLEGYQRSGPNLFRISDFLDYFPKLTSLQMECTGNTNTYSITANSSMFHFQNSIYPLIHLELHYVIFPIQKEGFETLVRVCPLLQVTKFIDCLKLYLPHINYLITHAQYLTTVVYESADDNDDDNDDDDNLIIEHLPLVLNDNKPPFFHNSSTKKTIQNTSMKTLSLNLTYERLAFYRVQDEEEELEEVEPIFDTLCYIFSKCVNLQDLSLSGVDLLDNNHDNNNNDNNNNNVVFQFSHFLQIIQSSWQGLQKLKLESISFPFSMMQQLANTCKQSLTHLYLIDDKHWDPLIILPFISQSFSQLQCLEYEPWYDSVTSVDVLHKLIECLQNAVFQHFLCELSIPTISLKETHDFLSYFPALESTFLNIPHNSMMFFLRSSKMMSQIKKLTLIASESNPSEAAISTPITIERSSINESIDAAANQTIFDANSLLSIPINHQLFDLSGYGLLQELHLRVCVLYPIELSIILTLPALQTFILLLMRQQNASLFDPNTYPANNLAPLKQLDMRYNLYQEVMPLTEEKLRTLLIRFTTLQEFIVSPTSLRVMNNTNKWWERVVEEYRYRVKFKVQED